MPGQGLSAKSSTNAQCVPKSSERSDWQPSPTMVTTIIPIGIVYGQGVSIAAQLVGPNSAGQRMILVASHDDVVRVMRIETTDDDGSVAFNIPGRINPSDNIYETDLNRRNDPRVLGPQRQQRPRRPGRAIGTNHNLLEMTMTPRTARRTMKVLAMIVVVAYAASACGGSDDTAEVHPPETTAGSDTESTEDAESANQDEDVSPGDDEPADDSDEPETLEDYLGTDFFSLDPEAQAANSARQEQQVQELIAECMTRGGLRVRRGDASFRRFWIRGAGRR